MERTQYITTDAVQDATGKRRVTLGDAISLAEARLYHQEDGDELVIDDVSARRLNNSDGWAVTFTVTQTVLAGPDTPVSQTHTIGGQPIGPDNPGEYGRTHDFKCPGCQSSSFTASPRSETYWAS